jgi:hypothetical protein
MLYPEPHLASLGCLIWNQNNNVKTSFAACDVLAVMYTYSQLVTSYLNYPRVMIVINRVS